MNMRVLQNPETIPQSTSVLGGSSSTTYPPPPAASAPTVTATAGVALGGQRAVVVAASGSAFYADKDLDAARGVAGLTQGAVAAAGVATIQTSGLMTEASWTWTADLPVWLGDDGLLTQTVPTVGYLVQIGTAIGATRLRIAPQLIAKV